MRPNKSIHGAVAALTAALVGSPIVHSEGANHSETSILLYNEKDRTRATEVNFSLTKEMRNSYTLDLRLTYDGLTGATPTGRSPSRNAQTITRPSGGKVVVTPAGEFPTDESFTDRRFAADLGLAKPLGRALTGNAGIQLSSELDYRSVGLVGGLVQDFPASKTSIGLSAAYMHDVVKPVSGYYEPYSPIEEDEDDERRGFGGQKKNVVDLVLSLTKVIGSGSMFRVSYSYDHATGYLTDPYKILSFVGPDGSENAGEPTTEIREKRPDYRTKHAIYTELRRHMAGSIIGLAYRYFWDDWGIRAHSVDFNFTIGLKSKGSLLPRARWYHQSRADFHRVYLIEGAPLPQYASADSRLSTFDAFTYGATYSLPVNESSKLNITAEYYYQRGDNSPPETVNSTATLNLFPRLDAFMLRLGYAHDF